MTVTSTYGETPPSNTGFEDASEPDFERETGPEDSTLQSDGITFRDRLLGALDGSRAYWVPPSLLTEPAPSLMELSAYAHRGPWTKDRMRTLGVVWFRAVALPVTVTCRYVEWVAQRPGRAVPVLALWWLFRATGHGPWIDTNLIHPVLTFVF